jgi:hypothetical protein
LCVIAQAHSMGEAGRRGRVQPITRTMGKKWASRDPLRMNHSYGRRVLFCQSLVNMGIDEKEVVSTAMASLTTSRLPSNPRAPCRCHPRGVESVDAHLGTDVGVGTFS